MGRCHLVRCELSGTFYFFFGEFSLKNPPKTHTHTHTPKWNRKADKRPTTESVSFWSSYVLRKLCSTVVGYRFVLFFLNRFCCCLFVVSGLISSRSTRWFVKYAPPAVGPIKRLLIGRPRALTLDWTLFGDRRPAANRKNVNVPATFLAALTVHYRVHLDSVWNEMMFQFSFSFFFFCAMSSDFLFFFFGVCKLFSVLWVFFFNGSGFYRVLPGFTGSHRVSLGCT